MAHMKLLLTFTFLTGLVFAANLPIGTPEQAGLSQERLNRINVVMKDQIAKGTLNGASGLIVRNGKVVFRGTWGEYKPDTIVRMYSMTKAVTGVAAMILYEEGRFNLNDPLSKYLPEFATMQVGKESFDALGKRTYYTVPAQHPILVRDLFRHTTGLDYAGPKLQNGDSAYKQIEMMGGAPLVPFNLAEAVKRLASMPLNDEPGTTFRYGYSIDVLGRLVEVLSGKTLDQFFAERIFQPLGMVDTAFYAPEDKWKRLATLYTTKRGGGIEISTASAQESFKKKPALLLGGAGLVSTLDDYSRFCMMLLNNGELDGTRILTRKTVELMHADQLGDRPRTGVLQEGYGFGLTFAVNMGPGKVGSVGSEGEYNWGGAAGTSFWIDPKEHMFGVFLINVLPPTGIPAADQFKRMAYLALE